MTIKQLEKLIEDAVHAFRTENHFAVQVIKLDWMGAGSFDCVGSMRLRGETVQNEGDEDDE